MLNKKNKKHQVFIINLSILILMLFIQPFFSLHCSAQSATDEKLAIQYLQNKEYDKALIYYEKFFNQRDGITYYDPYLLCLTKLNQFDKAERVIKKIIKRNPTNLNYMVDLGSLYINEGDKSKGKAQYESAIKKLGPIQSQIIALANSFIQLKKWDYAIKTYTHGRKLLNGFYPFYTEMAEVYFQKGDIAEMVKQYLNLLGEYGDQIQTVQNGLQPAFGENEDDVKNNIIKDELLRRIQSEPDKTIFSELLIWFFIQEKNFNGAFIQSKALDKRMHEEGDRMMDLGQLCVANQDYNNAARCFQYVIEKGKENINYVNARIALLNALYKKITEKFDYTPSDLQKIEANFINTLNELGKSANTIDLIKNLSHLDAFHLNNTTDAIALLRDAIMLPGLNGEKKAECKLELGDILLMTGEVWDASLLYSQVELDFKHEPIGQEAKLRNARLSFYNGEFKWAQAQLNILKAATEKLIANDAMALSLTISDNLKDSGDSLPLSMYAKADLYCFRKQYNTSISILDSILQKFPTTSLADDILFKKYQIRMKEGKFQDAAQQLQKLIDNYSLDILGDDATFKLAELYEQYLNNPTKAKQLYEEILTKYPDSLYTLEARKRFRRLRGDAIN